MLNNCIGEIYPSTGDLYRRELVGAHFISGSNGRTRGNTTKTGHFSQGTQILHKAGHFGNCSTCRPDLPIRWDLYGRNLVKAQFAGQSSLYPWQHNQVRPLHSMLLINCTLHGFGNCSEHIGQIYPSAGDFCCRDLFGVRFPTHMFSVHTQQNWAISIKGIRRCTKQVYWEMCNIQTGSAHPLGIYTFILSDCKSTAQNYAATIIIR